MVNAIAIANSNATTNEMKPPTQMQLSMQTVKTISRDWGTRIAIANGNGQDLGPGKYS